MPIRQTINFDNSFASEMSGFYVPQLGDKAPNPEIIQVNAPLADELGLDADDLNTADGAIMLSGSEMPEGSAPLSQVYAGHQFGGFSERLGDGRALLIGEVLDREGRRRDIQLKGSGRTPFSRGGDGKAAVGPVLREYLIGEAMHALNIPTTRALAAVTTGESVFREDVEYGAVLTRVASSHLRVGTFQFFAARGETDNVRKLADYAIKRHYGELTASSNPYLGLLTKVIDQQASLVAKWVAVGFVHGVMNTDNMTISGETIDYGPCAFMDTYDPKALFSSIDTDGRYAYGNQPVIAQWNLARFAETLVPLIDDNSDVAIQLATDALNAFPEHYQLIWLGEMCTKLGMHGEKDGDVELINQLYRAMENQHVDFTQMFRRLADAARGDDTAFIELFDDSKDVKAWLGSWLSRLTCNGGDREERAYGMDAVNPIYIPRNHKVEEALIAASKNANYDPFKKLLTVLERPFEKREGLSHFEEPAPADFGKYTTFCGT